MEKNCYYVRIWQSLCTAPVFVTYNTKSLYETALIQKMYEYDKFKHSKLLKIWKIIQIKYRNEVDNDTKKQIHDITSNKIVHYIQLLPNPSLVVFNLINCRASVIKFN